MTVYNAIMLKDMKQGNKYIIMYLKIPSNIIFGHKRGRHNKVFL